MSRWQIFNTCLLNMSVNHGTHLALANSTLGIVVASVTYIPPLSYWEKAMVSEAMTSFKEMNLTDSESSQLIFQRLAKKRSCNLWFWTVRRKRDFWVCSWFIRESKKKEAVVFSSSLHVNKEAYSPKCCWQPVCKHKENQPENETKA